jgi:hypothetical protein
MISLYNGYDNAHIYELLTMENGYTNYDPERDLCPSQQPIEFDKSLQNTADIIANSFINFINDKDKDAALHRILSRNGFSKIQ